MSEENQKSIPEQLQDMQSQLGEMLHYANSNSEHLSSLYMKLDDGIKLEDKEKQKGYLDRVDKLLSLQGELSELCEGLIDDMKFEANRIENEKDD